MDTAKIENISITTRILFVALSQPLPLPFHLYHLTPGNVSISIIVLFQKRKVTINRSLQYLTLWDFFFTEYNSLEIYPTCCMYQHCSFILLSNSPTSQHFTVFVNINLCHCLMNGCLSKWTAYSITAGVISLKVPLYLLHHDNLLNYWFLYY